MKTLMQLLGLVLCLIPSGLLAWVVWEPLRAYLFSLVPVSQYAGLFKLAILIIVAWGGGIGLSLGLFVLGLMFWANMIRNN